MEGSPYVNDDLKSKRDRRNKSARWTDRPTGVTNIVRTGRIREKVLKLDKSPYQGDKCNPKWTNVHKIDGLSHKVDDLKSKMDEFNSSPHSERITNNVKELSTKWTDHLNGVIIYSPQSGRIIKTVNMITSSQSGRIINMI